MQHLTMQKQIYLDLWQFLVRAETLFCRYVQFSLSWLKECDNIE